jgi:WD40 repeat protein
MKRFLFFLTLIFLFALNGCSLEKTNPVVTGIPLPQPTQVSVITPTVSATPTAPPPASQTNLSPAGQIISPENAIKLAKTGKISLKNPYRLYIPVDSQSFIVSNQENVVRFLMSSLKQENQVKIPEPGFLLDVSPQNNLVAVSSNYKKIELTSLMTGQVVNTLQPQSQFSAGSFSPDGKSIAVVKIDNIGVDLYDITTGKLIDSFSGFETAAPVYNAFIAPDGKTLIWVSRAKAQLMDMADKQLGPEFSHEDFIAGLALSPDGKILATSAGGTVNDQFNPYIFLWDAHLGSQVDTLKLPEAPAPSLAFSPDGQLLAAAVAKTIQIWQVSTRKLITTLEGPTENISFVAFSPDGRSLLASAQDSAVHLYQIVP